MEVINVSISKFRCLSQCQPKHIENQPIQTPSTHRQRLSSNVALTPRIGLANFGPNGASGTPMLQRNPTGRSPLANLNANSAGPGFTGYGMSAGLKVSNPAGSAANGFTRPQVRSRGRSDMSFGEEKLLNPMQLHNGRRLVFLLIAIQHLHRPITCFRMVTTTTDLQACSLILLYTLLSQTNRIWNSSCSLCWND